MSLPNLKLKVKNLDRSLNFPRFFLSLLSSLLNPTLAVPFLSGNETLWPGGCHRAPLTLSLMTHESSLGPTLTHREPQNMSHNHTSSLSYFGCLQSSPLKLAAFPGKEPVTISRPSSPQITQASERRRGPGKVKHIPEISEFQTQGTNRRLPRLCHS